MSPFTTDGITADEYANSKHEFNPMETDIGVGIQISDTCLDCGAEESDERHDLSGLKVSSNATAKIETLATTGADLITAERVRQIVEEGFDAKHDAEYRDGELLEAAMAYCKRTKDSRFHDLTDKDRDAEAFFDWPFSGVSWKPSDPVRMLVKAGALIAAEIDRLLAEKESQTEAKQ